ncbi:hypothetical protein O9992_24055 [Vibrio lentus]|nr:hypothetical protein [Vibrio lentus]
MVNHGNDGLVYRTGWPSVIYEKFATRHITAPEVTQVTLMLRNGVSASLGVYLLHRIPPATSIIGGVVILITIFIYTLVTMKNDDK